MSRRRILGVTGIRSEYDIRIGQLELDLSDLRDLPPGDTHVEADGGIGNVVVVVPEDVAVDVRADADYGEVEVFDVTEDGRNASLRATESGSSSAEGRLVIDAHVWAGRVEILFADGSALHADHDTVVDLQSDEVIRLLEGRMRLNITGVRP